MKKLVMVILGLFVFHGLSMAGEATTSSTVVGGHGSHDHKVDIPEFTDTDTQRQDWGYGVGLDTVVYSGSNPMLEEVRIDTRYDIENRETRVFAVAKVDLFSLIKG